MTIINNTSSSKTMTVLVKPKGDVKRCIHCAYYKTKHFTFDIITMCNFYTVKSTVISDYIQINIEVTTTEGDRGGWFELRA